MLRFVLPLVFCACVPLGLATPPLVYQNFKAAGDFMFNPAPQNWTDASKTCRLYKGHLAFPDTMAEAEAMWTLMNQFAITKVLSGFHDQFTEGDYFSAKGVSVADTSFNQWATGAPIGGASLNCGSFQSQGLVDIACSEMLPSICEEDGPGSSGNFLDYDLIPGHGYYKMFAQPTSFGAAMRRCYDDGAQLIILNSQEEFDAVHAKYNFGAVFVGVHQRFTDFYFVTIFDEPLEETGFAKWAPSEPSAGSASPFVAVSVAGLSTQSNQHGFICEHSAD